MKTKLLTSIAAAALIAGSGAVFAQGSGQEKSPGMSQGGSTGGSSGGMSQGGASQSAPAEKMSPGTTGQGSQSAPKAGQSADDTKSRSGSTAKDDDKSKSGSSARSDDDKSKAGSAAKDDDKSKSGSTAQGKDKAGSTTGQGAAGASASLTTEQKTKISTTIKQQNVQPAENVNFNISVGTVVPRSVELHTLPANVIEVYPAWRGYRFILVEEEIVIIDPATYRIVAVIVV